MKIQLFITLLATSFITGCVVYPTERTYFKPVESQQLELTKSQSCGYHRAQYDGLKNGEMSVFPDDREQAPLRVLIVTKGYEVKKENTSLVLDGKPVALGSFGQLYHHSHIRGFEVTVDEKPRNIENLKVIIDGELYEFNQKTESDIYYASINC
ncbi:MAG: hypothetical protein ACPG5L_04830 [Vibrio gallaecicus]